MFTFDTLKQGFNLPPNWFRANLTSSNKITLSHFYMNDNIPAIKFSMIIEEDLHSSLYIYGKLTHTHYIKLTSKDHLLNVLDDLSHRATCNGNNDSKFIRLISARGGVINNRKGMHYYINKISIVSLQ